MSVIPEYEMPWSGEEVKKILELLPKNTERIRIHFDYHDVKFDAKIPYICKSFPDSTTNIGASTGVTLLTTSLTPEVIDSFCQIINTKPAYSIDIIRLLYSKSVIDLRIKLKEVKILGIMEVPSACTIYAEVPTLNNYIHMINTDDYENKF